MFQLSTKKKGKPYPLIEDSISFFCLTNYPISKSINNSPPLRTRNNNQIIIIIKSIIIVLIIIILIIIIVNLPMILISIQL